MADNEYKSETRDSLIRELIEKVRKQNYEKYLLSIRLENIRQFHGAQINFDFPVTALIGTNGGGKTTIIGAIAILHKSIPQFQFFRKNRFGDDSMDGWKIEYELIEKSQNPKGTIRTEVIFQNNEWQGNGILTRPIKLLGIRRTLPPLEIVAYRRKLTTPSKPDRDLTISTREVEEFDNIKHKCEIILGKSLENFKLLEVTFITTKRQTPKTIRIMRKVFSNGRIATITEKVDPIDKFTNSESKYLIYIGDNSGVSYSEFHFGSGESSIIRSVAEIELMPSGSLILLEEIENGLHPVAVRKYVEYLVDAAKRKNIQIVFTTHSDKALAPLPPEAIWATKNGKLEQGKLSIDTLRDVSGLVEKRLAIFVEDDFAKSWIEAVIREKIGERQEEIKVYPCYGDAITVKTHLNHKANPSTSLQSLCFIDGDSKQEEDVNNQIIKLPGSVPEVTIYDSVLRNLDKNIARLTWTCQRPLDKKDVVANVVRNIPITTRDPHLYFNLVGLGLGLGSNSEAIVRGAFLSLWIDENPVEVKVIVDPIIKALKMPPK